MVSLVKQRRWILTAALCMFASALVAQDTTSRPTARGVVLNTLTHEPIARALVQSGGDAVLTDSTGHFEVGLPSGSAGSIAVRRPGYVSGPGSDRTVYAQDSGTDWTLYLTPQAVIAGHISTSSGEDAESVRVIVYRRRNRRGRQWWETQGLAATDSAGHFRLSTLQTPAEYLLMTVPATDREGRFHANSSTFGYAPAFYPEGGETSGTGLLSLAPGQQVNVELSLSRQPFFPVTIQLKNDVGMTPLSVRVHDETGLVSEFPTEWNAQKRSAHADLPNGHYFAELRSYNRPELYGRVEFAVAGAPVAGLSAVVLPLHPVLVQIRKDFTSAPSDQRQPILNGDIAQGNPGLGVTLIPTEGASDQVGALEPVPGSTDTSLFQLKGVTPGRYWVRTSAFEGYVSSITSGGVDLAREALTIGAGNSTPPLEVTLRNDSAQIHCTIQPPAGAAQPSSSAGLVFLFAIPTSPTTGQTIQGSAGAGNDATLNVAPGTYSVIALNQFLDVDELEPAALGAYIARGQSVTVEAQGSTNVTISALAASDASTGSEPAH